MSRKNDLRSVSRRVLGGDRKTRRDLSLSLGIEPTRHRTYREGTRREVKIESGRGKVRDLVPGGRYVDVPP